MDNGWMDGQVDRWTEGQLDSLSSWEGHPDPTLSCSLPRQVLEERLTLVLAP